MRCVKCGNYPFIDNPQKEDCEKSKKRKLGQFVKITDRLKRREKC